MRIISQDKCIDVSYDKHLIIHLEYGTMLHLPSPSEEVIKDDERYHIITKLGNEVLSLGKYDTKDRALEVMEEIRKSYIGDSQRIIVPHLDDIAPMPIQYIPVNHYFYMPKE